MSVQFDEEQSNTRTSGRSAPGLDKGLNFFVRKGIIRSRSQAYYIALFFVVIAIIATYLILNYFVIHTGNSGHIRYNIPLALQEQLKNIHTQ